MEMKFHFSSAETFENCPAKYYFRYEENLETIPSDDAANPLMIGTMLHRSMETDLETATKEYLMSYPVITDAHIEEVIKLSYWYPKLKELVPDGLHEVYWENDICAGTIDLLVPATKLDLKVPHGTFDLYDYKYSNNINHYMQSKQLHIYKYMYEKVSGRKIRNMFFIFIPKIFIKHKQDESTEEFRSRILEELNKKEIQIKKVEYDADKVAQFYETCIKIGTTDEFTKNYTKNCDWCDYKNYCLKGENTMILPSNERREIGAVKRRKLWLYGSAFSGKTTFVDSAPSPLNLNTDGNIQFVTMQFVPIKDTYEGRQKVLAWKVFKDTIDELEKTAKTNGFKTIVVDLLEDTYESCRLYMYDKLGITHESDDSFRAWDKVRTEFLSTIRRLINLEYENIVLISHEDTTKDITKRSGDKITAIKPNIPDKIANKVAGMVDIVARIVAEDDGGRTLNFKSDEVTFGGGRLKGVSRTTIPLDWDELCSVYDEANGKKKPKKEEPKKEPKEEAEEGRRTRRRTEEAEEPKKEEELEHVEGEEVWVNIDAGSGVESPFNDLKEPEEPKEEPKRRSRKKRGE